MEKEVKIIPPAGYEVDKENSTFECIKFKPISSKRWRDSSPLVNGYFVRCSRISGEYINLPWIDGYRDAFATEKQAKSALAMAQISQIIANDERFGGVVTDEEWNNDKLGKYCIYRCRNKIGKRTSVVMYIFLAFHTEEQRDLFLKENEDLVKDYLMID